MKLTIQFLLHYLIFIPFSSNNFSNVNSFTWNDQFVVLQKAENQEFKCQFFLESKSKIIDYFMQIPIQKQRYVCTVVLLNVYIANTKSYTYFFLHFYPNILM